MGSTGVCAGGGAEAASLSGQAPDLSVVVPCFNEMRRLPASVAGVSRWLLERGRPFEVILVDDGSSDGTGALLRRLAGDYPQVRVKTLPRNRGKGRASAEGVHFSRGTLVLLFDADASMPIEELSKLERAIADGADIAIASRAVPGAREIDQPFHRRLLGKAFNRLVRVTLLPGLRDTQCGFKLFRGETARQLFSQLEIDRFAFDIEILLRARRSRYRVTEVGVRWLNSDASSVSPLRDGGRMLWDLARLRLGSVGRS